jgi:hypothetical protein
VFLFVFLTSQLSLCFFAARGLNTFLICQKHFSKRVRATFAGSDSNALASHWHRIARVPWELHEPRLLLLAVVITHRRLVAKSHRRLGWR